MVRQAQEIAPGASSTGDSDFYLVVFRCVRLAQRTEKESDKHDDWADEVRHGVRLVLDYGVWYEREWYCERQTYEYHQHKERAL